MNDPKTQQALTKIIQKCWEDSKFQARFVAEPAAVLKEEGVDVPKGLDLKVVVNSENVHHLAIPSKPGAQLPDEALDQVAGGAVTLQMDRVRFIRRIPLTGLGGGTHDPGNGCIPNPC